MSRTTLHMTVEGRDHSNGRIRLTGWDEELNYVEVSNNDSETDCTSGDCSDGTASVYVDTYQFRNVAINVGSLCRVKLIVDGNDVRKFDFE